MPKSFDLKALLERASKGRPGMGKDPRVVVRLVLGVLFAANVAAALLLFKPWGGSPEDLARQLSKLRSQVQQRQASVTRLRALVAKVAKGRTEGDQFLTGYFLDRRTASSTILSELGSAAKEAGIKPKEHAFVFEPIEGSDTLSMMTISANYEGNYSDLVHFVNLLDHSPRLLILEQMQAAPQQAAGMLNVNFKLNAFVSREQEQR
jgi:Tfp pilus assembly protein PilO